MGVGWIDGVELVLQVEDLGEAEEAGVGARSGAFWAEVHEELDFLLHEYEGHMNYHKMKFKKGIFRALITLDLRKKAKNIVFTRHIYAIVAE